MLFEDDPNFLRSLLEDKKRVLRFLESASEDRKNEWSEVGEIREIILLGNVLTGVGLKITPKIAREILKNNKERLKYEIKELEEKLVCLEKKKL